MSFEDCGHIHLSLVSEAPYKLLDSLESNAELATPSKF